MLPITRQAELVGISQGKVYRLARGVSGADQRLMKRRQSVHQRLLRRSVKARGVAISLDGKRAWRDDGFVERLWRCLKYENVWLHAGVSGSQGNAGIARYVNFHNTTRPHSSQDKKTPNGFYFARPPAISRSA